MITEAEFILLTQPDIRQQIECSINRSHLDVALDKSIQHSSLIASQVKYLQRAKNKLPHLFDARCIIPSRAFEQSSSMATATSKSISGEKLLELTCGLGVDTITLSQNFKKVVTIERDPMLAQVAKENFRRLGVTNIEVINCSAEEYLTQCQEHFDWVYVDPDRRGEDGKKKVVLEECSPNIIELDMAISKVANSLAIKCSPLFDVAEAFRLYPSSRVEVVSVGGECKEVNIYVERGSTEPEQIGALAIGKGEVWMARSEIKESTTQYVDIEEYKYLVIPDVALQKSRLARTIIGEIATIESDNGYGFATEESIRRFNQQRHISRIEKIEWMGEYDPKKNRKELISRGISRAEILKRDFPYSVTQITKQLKIKEGGEKKIAFTKLKNQLIILILAQ